MKRDLKLSFKLGYQPYWGADKTFIDCKKAELSDLLLRLLSKNCLILNIDETLFSWTTAFKRGWLPKARGGWLKTGGFSGSSSMISSLDSAGRVFNMIIHSTNNSEVFIFFLCCLILTYKAEGIELNRGAVLLLDNAKIHKSKSVIWFLNEMKIHTIFLPAYSPDMAPVEKYFSLMKHSIK